MPRKAAQTLPARRGPRQVSACSRSDLEHGQKPGVEDWKVGQGVPRVRKRLALFAGAVCQFANAHYSPAGERVGTYLGGYVADFYRESLNKAGRVCLGAAAPGERCAVRVLDPDLRAKHELVRWGARKERALREAHRRGQGGGRMGAR